jgi:hypothetical protein
VPGEAAADGPHGATDPNADQVRSLAETNVSEDETNVSESQKRNDEYEARIWLTASHHPSPISQQPWALNLSMTLG